MSSLIAYLDEDQIMVGTDTLFTVHSVEEPNFFGSKAFLLPHLNVILAGSGEAGFLEEWWIYLNIRKSFPGIEALAKHAPDELRTLWAKWKASMAWPEDMEREQAVFHFGVSELTGELVGFTHISWENFEPEEVSFRVHRGPMLFAKPRCTFPTCESPSDFPRAFFPMMQEQRANQAAGVYGMPNKGVFIGGELQVHHMTKGGCVAYKIARFDDYDQIAKGLWG